MARGCRRTTKPDGQLAARLSACLTCAWWQRTRSPSKSATSPSTGCMSSPGWAAAGKFVRGYRYRAAASFRVRDSSGRVTRLADSRSRRRTERQNGRPAATECQHGEIWRTTIEAIHLQGRKTMRASKMKPPPRPCFPRILSMALAGTAARRPLFSLFAAYGRPANGQSLRRQETCAAKNPCAARTPALPRTPGCQESLRGEDRLVCRERLGGSEVYPPEGTLSPRGRTWRTRAEALQRSETRQQRPRSNTCHQGNARSPTR